MRTSIPVFVLRRLAAMVPLLLMASFLVFWLQDLAPGDTERILIGARPATPETLAAIREEFHLDEPFIEQYAIWLRGAVHLDFGTSTRTGEPVTSGIVDRLGITLWVGIYGFVVAMVFGVPLGILAAVKRGTTTDRGVVAFGVIGVSAPAFATGIFLLYIFAVRLGWFPVFGEGEGAVDRFYHLTLPAVTLALGVMALVVKLTRAGMIEALDQDHVVFAKARGLSSMRVLTAYGLRNALVPVVTAAGLVLSGLLVGSVLVEVTFALNGIGALFVESVTKKDIPMVQGVVILTAIVIVLVNLVTDLLYLAIDPRIRFERSSA